MELHDISEVEVVGGHRLRLTFDDGTVGEVEFAGRKWRGVLEPLADPEYFARVRIDPEAGTIALAQRRRSRARAALRGSQAQPEPTRVERSLSSSRAAVSEWPCRPLAD